MNKSRKGWSRELQCRKELEEQGWTILFKSQSIRFGKVDFGPQNEKHEEAKFDVVAVIAHLYNKIKLHYKTNKDLKFTSLLPPGSKKEDKVYTFIPLLHLENERKVNMLQTEHFGEISIQLAKPQAN